MKEYKRVLREGLMQLGVMDLVCVGVPSVKGRERKG